VVSRAEDVEQAFGREGEGDERVGMEMISDTEIDFGGNGRVENGWSGSHGSMRFRERAQRRVT
jgi:hypothetical protein